MRGAGHLDVFQKRYGFGTTLLCLWVLPIPIHFWCAMRARHDSADCRQLCAPSLRSIGTLCESAKRNSAKISSPAQVVRDGRPDTNGFLERPPPLGTAWLTSPDCITGSRSCGTSTMLLLWLVWCHRPERQSLPWRTRRGGGQVWEFSLLHVTRRLENSMPEFLSFLRAPHHRLGISG